MGNSKSGSFILFYLNVGQFRAGNGQSRKRIVKRKFELYAL